MRSLSILLLTLLAQGVPAQAASHTIAIEHVTLIDPADGTRRNDMTVVIDNTRISRVASSRALRLPKGVRRRVDGHGKFLIPGLWDMHVHLFNNGSRPGTDNHATFFPLFLANGVIGVRDMWTDPADNARVRRWRRDISAGRMIGPRIIPGSSILDGVPPEWPNSVAVADARSARAAVRREAAAGAGFIKVYNRLSRPAYFAIMQEARRLHLPVAGHVPIAVTATEASAAGQRSIEHLTDMVASCSAREAELRALPDNRDRAILSAAAYDPAKCVTLGRRLARNQTAQDPTLVVQAGRLIAPFDGSTDARLRFVDEAEQASWKESDLRQQRRKPDVLRALFGAFQHIVRDQERGGAMILAGTDLGNPHVFAGSSLHDELGLLVSSGLSPRAALVAATTNPVRFLGLQDSLGTIEAGKLADVVLLDADPLADIANIRRIAAVISNGRFFDKSELAALQANAAMLAAQGK